MATTRTFEQELESLINRHSVDNQLNIPDYAIKDYMMRMLGGLEILSQEIRRHNSVRELADKHNIDLNQVNQNKSGFLE